MVRFDNRQPFRIEADHIRIPRRVLSDICRFSAQYDDFEKLSHTFFLNYVQEKLPTLFDLPMKVRSLLEKGHRFVLLNKFSFLRDESRIRDFLILSLTSCIGRPTATDQVENRIIWKVTSETRLPEGHTRTVTEHNLEAELHTDTSYKDNPERYVAFFVVRRAECGGGLSYILDGRKLVGELAKSSPGKECLKALASYQYPFRVPTSFTRARREETAEVIFAPIISDTPLIRFRYDCIVKGFNCLPSYATKEALWAVDYFRKALTKSRRLTFDLNFGEILLTNNHEILHGRTAFTDMKRLLLRVRMESFSKGRTKKMTEAELS